MTTRTASAGLIGVLIAIACAGCTQSAASPSPSTAPGSRPLATAAGPAQQTTVALISDFGQCDDGERAVADMVRSWEPPIVFTAGDNSQGVKGCDPFTESVGAYYGDFLTGPQGPRLFPTLGNHDYEDAGAGVAAYRAFFPYLDTGADPLGRWYVKSVGNLNVYILDSEVAPAELTRQQDFLKTALSHASPRTWNVVVMHRPPFTSGPHPPNPEMQPRAGWAYKEWGANLVISGHQHVLEDVVVDGLHYVTAGVGGQTLTRPCPKSKTEGSLTCIEGLGAARLVASDTTLAFEYVKPGSPSTPAYRVEITRPS